MSNNVRYRTEGTVALEPEPTPRLRLYEGGAVPKHVIADNRSHVKALVLLALALTMSLTLGISAMDAMREASVTGLLDSAPKETISVKNGDTLWSIAERHHVRGTDTKSVVAWIEEENGLTNPTLMVGETLLVPVLQE